MPPYFARSTPSTARRRLAARIVLGLLAGALYAAADATLDHVIETNSPLRSMRAFNLFHGLVDFALPIFVGALLGVALHVLRLRAEAAEDALRRADELRGRLHKIERDQAVWVVAASLLHEIKNPLHALGLLLDEVASLPEGDAAERAGLLERARAQIDRILSHLGALKSLPVAHEPALPGVDLGALAARIAADLGPRARADDVRIGVRPGPAVAARANATYVQVVLENLVENSLDAIRARGGPGSVEIEIGEEGERAFLRVRDDGPGLDERDAASVFEPLHSKKPLGLGIGLSIARALARAMQGDLVLERPSPATFRLDLARETP